MLCFILEIRWLGSLSAENDLKVLLDKQAKCEPELCPGSKDLQQHPKWDSKDHSQEPEGADY